MTSGRNQSVSVLVRKARSALFLARHYGRRGALRTRNLAVKRWRHYSSRGRRSASMVRERAKNAKTAAFNLTRFAWRRILNVRKPVIKRMRRSERAREVRAFRRAERQALADIGGAARPGRPLILGPWLSEVGFESLYWVPFLRWLVDRYELDPSRLIALSRGGVGSWYDGIASRYVEIFDAMAPGEFARRNDERRSGAAGQFKHFGLSPLDEELLAHARRSTGASDAGVVHPSLMYRLFKQYWLGHSPLAFVQDHVRTTRWEVPRAFDVGTLPDEYIAVKLYTAASLRPADDAARELRAIVAALAREMPVVLLDTGVAFDDHADYAIGAGDRVLTLHDRMTPANNLGVQTQVIAGARRFVGTCGGLAWIAPLLGVPTVALFTEPDLLRAHLLFARTTYMALDAAPFATVDLRGLRALGTPALTGHT